MSEPWLLALCLGMAVLWSVLAVAANDQWGVSAAVGVLVFGFVACGALAGVVVRRRESALRDSAARGEFDAAERAAIGIAAAALSASDTETAEHSDEVAELCGLMCEEFEVDETERRRILAAARLHDIGKLAVPAGILNKPDALAPDEWEVIQEHTLVGERVLESVPELESAAPLVRHSHEHWDGSGYPDGLAGEEIPLGSRMILCADAFHAIRSDRPYRQGRTPNAAFAEMRAHAGTQFDPQIVEAMEEYAERLSKRVAPRIRPSRRMVALLIGAVLALLGTALALELLNPSQPGADQQPAVPQEQSAPPASPASGAGATPAAGKANGGAAATRKANGGAAATRKANGGAAATRKAKQGPGTRSAKGGGGDRRSGGASWKRGGSSNGGGSSTVPSSSGTSSSGTSSSGPSSSGSSRGGSSSSSASADRGRDFPRRASAGNGPDFETPVRARGNPTHAKGVARGRPATVIPRGHGK